MDLHRSEGHIVAGALLDDHRFLCRLMAAQLFQLAKDPRNTEDARQLTGNPELESLRRLRQLVQRAFDGAKAKNVESYAQYIVSVHEGQDGMAPPITFYSQKELSVKNDPSGAAEIQIPWDAELVAIDGETQLAARFEAARIKEETRRDFVPVLICHGKPIEWARTVFHDLNSLGVQPNAALRLSMDGRDPLTQVAREVMEEIPFFRGRVHTTGRQISGRDKEVMTLAALRVACVTLAEGISGVKHGTRPVAIDLGRLPLIQRAALEWFASVADVVGPAIENRSQSLASSSSVMAAIGAVGHGLVEIDDDARRDKLSKSLIEKLRGVRWEKGKAWEGIAGKFTPKGKFSTSGAKDAAYAVYSALNDESSSGY